MKHERRRLGVKASDKFEMAILLGFTGKSPAHFYVQSVVLELYSLLG